MSGRAIEGERLCQKVLATQLESESSVSVHPLMILAEFARYRGGLDQALGLLQRAVALARKHGLDSLAGYLHPLAETLAGLGRLDEAEAVGLEALELRRRARRPAGVAHAMLCLATVAEYRGDWERSLELSEAAGRLLGEAGEARMAAGILPLRAFDLVCLGRDDDALQVIRQAIDGIDLPVELYKLAILAEVLGAVLTRQGEELSAAQLFAVSDSVWLQSALRRDPFIGTHELRAELPRRIDPRVYEGILRDWSRCSSSEAIDLVQKCATEAKSRRPS